MPLQKTSDVRIYYVHAMEISSYGYAKLEERFQKGF